ncbi:hypothetical protein N7462_008295 [Penicillium macrosclerotiorum]|uniref:uncharacterized protein n=1 Tax=Penicillium macrosclerotiorum TaxID=303699 RepID=UPI0025465C31|nr:uncharacterized protein N7462_008295 [Penicillium macrosclerotiorum]KAJ5675398.1 hypothetical protein N7462_008295 [Penicillium macrosclerotiorum]
MVLFADAAPALAGTTILLTTLAILTFGLRVYCRISRRSWGLEDWIMSVSWVSTPEEVWSCSPNVPFCVLVAGCLGGSFNGIGARDSTLTKPGNEKYQIEAQKVIAASATAIDYDE